MGTFHLNPNYRLQPHNFSIIVKCATIWMVQLNFWKCIVATIHHFQICIDLRVILQFRTHAAGYEYVAVHVDLGFRGK
jgi:hypothetical protein